MANLRPVVALVLVMVVAFGDLGGVAAQDGGGGPSPSVGRFERFGMDGTLTEDDVTATADGIRVESPIFASELRVSGGYLKGRLGDWAANRAFGLDAAGNAVFPGEDTAFASFVPSASPAFTMGSFDSIRFTTRPMWVSAAENADGSIRLDFDDGDTTGQAVYVAKEWLWARGMHRPIATHEDGTDLEVAQSPDNDGFVIQMPHFSWVILTAADIDVKERANGVTSPHADVKRWDAAIKTLEVDVGPRLNDVEILIEKDWVDANIPHPAIEDSGYLLTHGWMMENLSGTWYYNVGVDNRGILTTLRLMEFRADSTRVFTAGNVASLYFFEDPLLVEVQTSSGLLTVRTKLPTDVGNHTAAVGLNVTLLDSLGITIPRVRAGGLLVGGYSVSDGVLQYGLTEAAETIHAIDQDPEPVFATTNGLCDTAMGTALGPPDDYFEPDWFQYPSTARMWVLGGWFCWEWDLTPGPTTQTPVWWMVNAGVRDAEDASIGCSWPTSSAATVTNRQGAGKCEWPDDSPIVKTKVSFFATSVGPTEHEERYSGKATFGNCWTGGGYTLPLAFPWVAVLIGIGLTIVAEKVVDCKIRWEEKRLSKQIWDEQRPADGLITVVDRPFNVTSGISIQIIDDNARRADTWDFVEASALGYHDEDKTGPQSLRWALNNVTGGTASYTADISIIQTVGQYDTSTLTVTYTGNDNLADLDAHQGKTKFDRTVPLQVVDWEYPEDGCVPQFVVNGLVNDVWHTLQLGSLAPEAPCLNSQMSQASGAGMEDPWISFDVLATSLPPESLLAQSGSISRSDVLDADGSMGLAMASKVVADTLFLDGIQNLTAPANGPETPCGMLETEHEARFHAVTSGTGTRDGLPKDGADEEFRLICFEGVLFVLAQ